MMCLSREFDDQPTACSIFCTQFYHRVKKKKKNRESSWLVHDAMKNAPLVMLVSLDGA